MQKVVRAKRNQRGSAISEMAPALFLLLVVAVFPVLDLIFDGLGYCAVVTLNNLQLREAVRVPKSQAIDPNGAVQLGIPNNWRASAFGGLAPLMADPVTEVSYDVVAGNAMLTISTTVSVRPLLVVPFFPNVPGLSAPMPFTITTSRILENPGFLNY
ncbi:hypothetical protein BH10CYA1_BH10CYA1_19760 [soil metagenome]